MILKTYNNKKLETYRRFTILVLKICKNYIPEDEINAEKKRI